MAHSDDTLPHASLLPPNPRAGRRRYGPTLLLLLGIAAVGVVYAKRERLRPAPLTIATIEPQPTLFEATSVFAPLAVPLTAPPPPPFVVPALTTIPTPTDAFSEPLLPAPLLRAAKPEFDAARYKLQSIVVGRRGGSCLINGRAYRVGDALDGAMVYAIDRDRVVLRAGRTDVELRLNIPNGNVAMSPSR